MKVIIPAAGAGKRLFPHTFTKPKPMVYIAGKPIIGHILDRMIDLEPEAIILVVGYRKEQIISYVNENYSNIFNITYVEQEHQLGLGHSIYVAKNAVGDSPIMIALGDMIFKAGYKDFYLKHFNNGHCDGSIGVWEVDEPEKYGIVESDGNCITMLVEKPIKPVSNHGIAGVYFIQQPDVLFDIIGEMVDKRAEDEEIQLTDALQGMVERGNQLKMFYVSSWYDCGHSESLLKTNQILLEELSDFSNHGNLDRTKNLSSGGHDMDSACTTDSVVIKPVFLGNNVRISNSVIGPHVSIADNSCVEASIISNSIVGTNSVIKDANLRSSVIGDNVDVNGKYNSLDVGDSSSIKL